ncbi:MAG TPA: ATP-binding protein [Abditibacteriaceae bacterium]
MRRLFWKIFGWFWGAMVLIGLALYFVVLTTRPDSLPQAWRDTAEAGLRATGRNAADTYETQGPVALLAFLNTEARLPGTHYWLFNNWGRELSGAPLPSARPTSDGNNTNGDSDLLPPEAPPSSAQINALRIRALEARSAIFQHEGPRTMAALFVESPQKKNYVLVSQMPSPRFGRPATEPRTQMLGGLAALVLSGLFCFGLVFYLMRPLTGLREATRQLAEGNLSARTGAHNKKRRDEVADLGRDFDAMAERIEILMNAQQQLLGDISHELRSPLTRISMALALARRHAANDNSNGNANGNSNGTSHEELIHTLDRIGRETTRLNILIGQLLELTRLESGQAMRVPLDVAQLAREVVSDAEFEAKNTGRAVEIIAGEPCLTKGSRELLRSALDNVIRNALRHTAPGTTVHVNLLRHDEWILVRVRDHGSGAPPEALKKLFDPFYRVEAARDRNSGGFGLGLAITQRAIRSHGGNITARNSDTGGLEIIMSLPAEDWEAEIDKMFEENDSIFPL